MKMEVKEGNKTKRNDSRTTLFRFQLNPTQKILFVIISLIGVLYIPFILAGYIFLNLFQSIFTSLPAYLSNPEYYHDDYLFINFAPIITSIIIYSIFFILSLYTLKRLLKPRENSNEQKRNIILQDRIVHWFGFKITHGQSLFIFSTSVAGMLFIAEIFIHSYNPIFRIFRKGIFESLCLIPWSPNHAISNEFLLTNVPTVIQAIFVIFCLYSLFITRRGKPMTPLKKNTKNYGVFIFIVSFVVFILLSARIFCHLFLFTDLGFIIGTTPNATNSYQNNDFIITVVLFCICLALMIISYYMRDNSHKVGSKDLKLSWINIELTPQRALILLSVAIVFTLFFTNYYLVSVFLIGIFGFSLTYYSILFNGIFIGIIVFCFYPIGKISKDNRLTTIVENIKNSREYETNWFGFKLNRLYSVIFLSVSCGLITLYMFQLVVMNMSGQAFISGSTSSNIYLLIFPLMTVMIVLIIVVNIYTIKKTIYSIKSSPLKNKT